MPNLKRLIPIGFQVHPRTESALEAYRAKAQSANAELNAALRESSEILKKIQTEISYSTSQLSDLQSLIAASKAESERLIADLRQSDLDRVERQTKEAQGAISAVNKKLNQFVDRAGIEIAESVSEWQVKAEESLKDLNQRREEARGIVQSVGEILTTGTYADRASTETDKADKFRNITIGLFVIGLLIILSNYIIYAIAFAVGEKVALAETWQALTARLVTGLAVALPAFYTARESARHRTNADTAKQRELEISTLGPFIELLPEEQKSAIRERLTDRYFGNKIEPHVFTPPYDADALTRSLVDLVRRSGGDAA